MYTLKPEMAEELRNTNNRIYQKSPNFLKKANFIATIGDICTLKIFEEIREPNLCIVDMKTKRNIELKNEQKTIMEKIGTKEIEVKDVEIKEPATPSLRSAEPRREYLADSGASVHLISRECLSKKELKRIRKDFKDFQ